MTITTEDGTIVADANSYADTTDVIAFAAARGVTIASEDAEGLIIRAMDYIETRSYQGCQVSFGVQPLQWPRDNVYVDDNLLPDTTIPLRLKNAQCQLCIDLQNEFDPQGIITRQVKEESFAVFRKVYMDGAVDSPVLQKVNAWLAPLLDSDGLSFRVGRSYG
jgi:hypothetical protein